MWGTRGLENRMVAKSFQDLDVYKRLYAAMIQVMQEVTPRLPAEEKFDLKDQLSRSCKAIPRLIAEGYGKRHQKAGFQKYIDDAMAECNEMVVSISQARDIYTDRVNTKLCDSLIDGYDKSGRQLYKLGNAWTHFKTKQP